MCCLGAVLLALTSCKGDDETVWVDDDLVDDGRDAIVFVYSPSQLGDITYNDQIYRGVTAAAYSNNLWLQLEYLDPTDSLPLGEQIDAFLWAQNLTFEGDDSRTLIVWCNNSYEPLLRERAYLLTENPLVTHLLVETDDTTLAVNTLRFSLYGAAYQAARATSEAMTDVEAVALLGDGSDDVVQGFLKGLNDGNRAVSTTFVPMAAADGVNLADSAYHVAFQLDKSYQMVVPACSEIAQGLTRYNRERAESFYTMGIDADMRPYSARVPMSMTKDLASALEQWIADWAAEKPLVQHVTHGLESGYCSLVVSADYQPLLSSIVEQTKAQAIQREKDYLARQAP